jgi:hypothetical protein
METNKILLNKELADKIKGLLGNIRTSVVELATIAANIRNQYLDATGKKYDGAFQAFWKNHGMEKNFGSQANFTKYANAGDAIGLVKAQYEQYESRLPITLTALYEFSMLTQEEMELCLENTFSRTEVTSDRAKWKAPKKPKPLITPSIQSAAIKAWRMKWRNPKAAPTDKRRLKIAEIKVHGSLYDFKGGKPSGEITISQIDEITSALKAAIAQFPDVIIRLDLEDEKLKAGYDKRLAADIAKGTKKAIQAKKKPKKSSVKKSKD